MVGTVPFADFADFAFISGLKREVREGREGERGVPGGVMGMRAGVVWGSCGGRVGVGNDPRTAATTA